MSFRMAFLELLNLNPMLPTHIARTAIGKISSIGLVTMLAVTLCFLPTFAFGQSSHQALIDDFAKKFVNVEFERSLNLFRFDATSKFHWPGKTTEQVEAIFQQAILPKLQVALAGAKKTARQVLQDDFTVAEFQTLTATGQREARTRVFGRFQYAMTAIVQNVEVSVYKANAVTFQKLGLDMKDGPFK